MDGTGPLRRIEDPYEWIKTCRMYNSADTVPAVMLLLLFLLFSVYTGKMTLRWMKKECFLRTLSAEFCQRMEFII